MEPTHNYEYLCVDLSKQRTFPMYKIAPTRITAEPAKPSAPPLDHHPDAYLHRRLCALAQERPLPSGAGVPLAQRIRAMVGRDGNIDAPDNVNNTPLHVLAARTDNAERNTLVMSQLLTHGANVNARNRDASTPLHVAVAAGRDPTLVRLLLEHGADRTALDKRKRRPVSLARSGEIAGLLLR